MMLVISWFMAMIAFLLGILVYKYIDVKGQEQQWGDSINGLRFQTARNALLALGARQTHAKNWRPQLLVFVATNENGSLSTPELLSLAGQLKKGQGLLLLSSIVNGSLHIKEDIERREKIERQLLEVMQKEKVNGFTDVILTPNIVDGLQITLQAAGIGAMRPNTVLFGWPRDEEGQANILQFYTILRVNIFVFFFLCILISFRASFA